ncbi:MAG: hypothetical protein C4287_23355 [Leptolyngbya sp. ERB_1_2]
MGYRTLINYDGLLVLDFHPIHLYLNTEKFCRYTGTKNSLHDVEVLDRTVCTDYFLIDFVSAQ